MGAFFDRMMGQTKTIKESLEKIEVIGESGAGMVKVQMNGHFQVREVIVDDEIYQEGKAVVLDLIRSATNNASIKAREAVKEKLTEMARGFGLPPNLSSLL